MILTPLNIQIAIIKAFYALAKKSVKYYTALAFGKNNTCLFKEIRLLRAYIDILRNFKIVGSTITCSCCVEGDYTVLLNELSELTEAKIQFSCNNSGSMFYNNISYPFTYFYDSDNKIIVIQFSTLIYPSTDNFYALTLDQVVFTEDCSFEPNTISPIEVGVIEPVDGIPIIVNNVYGNWDGNITIYEPDGITLLNIVPNPFTIPSNILNDPEAVAAYWNANGPTDWILLYDGTQFTMLTSFDGTDYSTYIVEYNQYEGGTNSLISPTSFIPQNFIPTGTTASVIVDIPNTFVGGVAATSTITPAIPQEFITVPEQATTVLEILSDIFNYPGTKATAQFVVKDVFFRRSANINYIIDATQNVNWSVTSNSSSPFADIEDFITTVNNNLLYGYPLSLVSTQVVTNTTSAPATTSAYFLTFAAFSAGDIISIDITSNYYNYSIIAGTYTVLLGDTAADIANGLIADVIANGIFEGTVTTDATNVLFFTAPSGSGSLWNDTYNLIVFSSSGSAGGSPPFSGGNDLIENQYTLAITAPTEGSSYNSYLTYGNGYNNPFSSGADPATTFRVKIVDDITGTIYDIQPNNFTSIDDFITAFNAAGPTQAVNIGSNGIYTQVEFTAPVSNINNIEYNTTTLLFEFDNGNYLTFNTYFGGVDITECVYSLNFYDPLDILVLPTIENLTPTNYASLNDLVLDIQNNINNTYVFGFSVDANNNIATTFPYPFVPPDSLTCSTYNGYYFILNIGYISLEYVNYTSSVSTISGGVDGYSETYEISDSVNSLIFTRAQNTFNYPNGSEIQNGLIPDFNSNNSFSYLAQYVGVGPNTLEVDATVSNNFLAELTTATITNGQEIFAFIDTTYIGKYQAPSTGVLPSYSNMIIALNNNIISTNAIPGLISNFAGSGIFQISPPTQAAAFNGKSLKIFKQTYTTATVALTFSGTTPALTIFSFDIPGIGTIGSYIGLSAASGSVVATNLQNSINSLTSTTNITATAVGAVLTIYAYPYTGSSFNNTPLQFTLYGGVIIINGNTYAFSGNYPPNHTFAYFGGGATFTPTIIKQATFANGVPPLTTTRVRFKSPIQPLTAPEYGTGNWAFNSEFFFYNYNVGEYIFNNLYSGGIDPTVGQFIVDILDPALAVYVNLYNDITPQNYISRQSLASIFNATNAFPNNFQINLFQVFPIAAFLSPPTSFDFFNTYKFRYSYDYVSPQYLDYIDVTTTFIGGVDPVLTPYDGEFVEGDIGPFITDNPCIPTIVEQICLTNSQINKIVKHIDKLVK